MKNSRILALGLILLTPMVFAKPDKSDKEHKHHDLPPGLAKKYDREGRLPPGWQKEIEVGKTLDDGVYDHKQIVVPIDNKGVITVEIDGRLLRLYDATREIVEILK